MAKVEWSKIKMVHYGSMAVNAVYQGVMLVWKAAKDFANSCFGSGKWEGNKPWKSNDIWRGKP